MALRNLYQYEFLKMQAVWEKRANILRADRLSWTQSWHTRNEAGQMCAGRQLELAAQPAASILPGLISGHTKVWLWHKCKLGFLRDSLGHGGHEPFCPLSVAEKESSLFTH